jgi:hypothetical protein
MYATGSAIIVIFHLTRLCLCLKQYVRNSVAGSENCNQSASELVGDFRPHSMTGLQNVMFISFLRPFTLYTLLFSDTELWLIL